MLVSISSCVCNRVHFVTTHLGRMKEWAACNLLDWVTCFPLHFTLAYTVYRESRTRQVVYIHVHYGVHGEIYIGIDSRSIDLSLCCIICSQIEMIRYKYLVTWTIGSPPCIYPKYHLDSTPLLENRPNERTMPRQSGCPCSWKIAGSGALKNPCCLDCTATFQACQKADEIF